MTLLSKIADGYESGRYEWVQGEYGDDKRYMVDNPERTPRFCPIGAIFALGSEWPDFMVAERGLGEVVRELGYTNYYTYNDAPGRTLNEVLETLRAADRRVTMRNPTICESASYRAFQRAI